MSLEPQAQDEYVLYIPDFLQNWPWPRAINPYYEEVTRESDAWFKSFKPFNKQSQYAFDLCDIGECEWRTNKIEVYLNMPGRFAALIYPYIGKEHL